MFLRLCDSLNEQKTTDDQIYFCGGKNSAVSLQEGRKKREKNKRTVSAPEGSKRSN
jgi:hypothetical protein